MYYRRTSTLKTAGSGGASDSWGLAESTFYGCTEADARGQGERAPRSSSQHPSHPAAGKSPLVRLVTESTVPGREGCVPQTRPTPRRGRIHTKVPPRDRPPERAGLGREGTNEEAQRVHSHGRPAPRLAAAVGDSRIEAVHGTLPSELRATDTWVLFKTRDPNDWDLFGCPAEVSNGHGPVSHVAEWPPGGTLGKSGRLGWAMTAIMDCFP